MVKRASLKNCPFKKGDLIRCNNAAGSDGLLTEGAFYKVESVERYDDEVLVYLENVIDMWSTERFVLDAVTEQDLKDALRMLRDKVYPDEPLGIGVYRRMAWRAIEQADKAEAKVQELQVEVARLTSLLANRDAAPDL